MFKENFIKICNVKGIPPTVACRDIGLSAAAFTKWDDSSVPRRATLQKFADYFGVTVDYLLGKEEEKKPTATEDSEPGEDVIIYHRDGKTKRKKLTKEQMDMLATMIEALPDNGEGL